MSIGVRLREERERLKLTQPAFGEIAQAAKRTVISWEQGASTPTAAQLALLAEAGMDVLYVITGSRTPGASSAAQPNRRESALLDNYHHSDEEGKRALESAALVAAKAAGASVRSGDRDEASDRRSGGDTDPAVPRTGSRG
ncbi:transcriptional regulator [Burkholderia sp. Ac-20345]|uniref:helix-turn-helix transcriptional regulator n=1 Tax=Burkholderia sp. Ac-20345 TaxID=2703891 RepID=UPI00197B6AC7|nr:transcriptional regulator [Burkholderia sp. Ac-20345]MBN3779930.1 transcriptional regulator [Burkholderia sp. Ac-20345]